MKTKTKRIWLTVISIFVIAIIMSTITACNKTPDIPEAEEDLGPYFIAHRGYSISYVDNTEAAFRAAAEMSFYGIETDIRKTKDGYYVCNHDESVKYADGTEKVISETDRAELLSKPLKNTKTTEPAYLCTFEAYLRACKDGNKVAVIELKDSLFSVSDMRKILGIVDENYDREKITFISFSYFSLLNAKSADATIPLQYLSQTKNDTKFDACLTAGISIDVKLSSDHKENVVTEDLVQAFHDVGLTVNVWTVDKESDLQAAYEYGVDYITTDVFHK